MSGNCHRMRATLSSSSPNRALLCVSRTYMRRIGMRLLPLLLLLILQASSPAQSNRQVNFAGNQGFPGGASVGCTANCGVQANTNGALQNFDAVQVSLGNCLGVVAGQVATENNPTCATSVIEVGDTITWVFDDGSAFPAQHSATAGNCTASSCPISCPGPGCTGEFDTGVTSTLGKGFTFNFPTSKVIPYFC